MVAPTLDQQLYNYIRNMHQQGILDHNFDQLKSLQTEENPQFVLEVINMFNRDADHCIAQITHFLNEANINFGKIIDSGHQLKGCCSSVGGQRMSMACTELRNAAENSDKERCFQMFQLVKQEYNSLRDCFNHIAYMERRIITYEARRR